jgi:cysteine desulfurase
MFGGGHERGLRPGTINVPGVVGMGVACALAIKNMAADAKRLQGLRDGLENSVLSEIKDARVNGCKHHRLPHVSNISFANIDSALLLSAVPEIGASTGSACSSANVEPSYVIKAIGVPKKYLHGSIRFSLGRGNTAADLRYTANRIISTVMNLASIYKG